MATKTNHRQRATDEDRLLEREIQLRLGQEEEAPWTRNRNHARKGHPDLRYLPQGRSAWNGTLAALAYSQTRARSGDDIIRWAAMHGVRPSRRAAELGEGALVLWHGTSRERAERIREVGLHSKRGLWTTREPRIAHGYTRGRAQEHSAGSATVVLVLDRGQVREGVDYSCEGKNILRFQRGLGREHVVHICWAERVETIGEVADEPRPWGRARFKKADGRWVPRSRPPVRLDDDGEYASFDEWLRLSLARIVHRLGRATALELMSSLYATLDPWEALTHDDVLTRAAEVCQVRRSGGGTMYLSREDVE